VPAVPGDGQQQRRRHHGLHLLVLGVEHPAGHAGREVGFAPGEPVAVHRLGLHA